MRQVINGFLKLPLSDRKLIADALDLDVAHDEATTDLEWSHAVVRAAQAQGVLMTSFADLVARFGSEKRAAQREAEAQKRISLERRRAPEVTTKSADYNPDPKLGGSIEDIEYVYRNNLLFGWLVRFKDGRYDMRAGSLLAGDSIYEGTNRDDALAAAKRWTRESKQS